MLQVKEQELAKAREEKDYQIHEKRKAEAENTTKRASLQQLMKDIEDLGKQINLFYEKFQEV